MSLQMTPPPSSFSSDMALEAAVSGSTNQTAHKLALSTPRGLVAKKEISSTPGRMLGHHTRRLPRAARRPRGRRVEPSSPHTARMLASTCTNTQNVPSGLERTVCPGETVRELAGFCQGVKV